VTRAVLDPNVVVSAAIRSDGAPARCVHAHAEGRFELVVSPLLLGELRAVLRRRKFRPYLTLEQADRLVEALARSAMVVDDPPAAEAVSRDPADDYLVALARASSAHVLVTGDRDLLELELGDMTVATPRAFLEVLPP
jgi:putative PIN family toxin of toxin-antitoxin system